ncbi:hypothetical protein TI03_02925, partial [Achromatium sp. WMS1]
MSFFPSLVPILDIACHAPNTFDSDQVHKAAQSIVDLEGLTRPLIVRETGLSDKTGLFTYELVDGVFEYYAAIEAKKIKSFEHGDIHAYIIPKDKEKVISEQISIFREKDDRILQGTEKPLTMKPATESSPQNEDAIDILRRLEQRLATVEEVITTKIEEIFTSKVEQIITPIIEKITTTKISQATDAMPVVDQGFVTIEAPEAVNDDNNNNIDATTTTEDTNLVSVVCNDSISDIEPTTEDNATVTEHNTTAEDVFISFLNEASETDIKALKVGITGKTINILITERNRQPFTSRK